MAFPHPQSAKDDYRESDIPHDRSVVWKFLKRAIDIPNYRDSEDDVNPAKNRTFGGVIHGPYAAGRFCEAPIAP